MDLIGGDTVSTKETLVLSVTVVGRVEKNRQLLRGRAEAGDVLFLTGPVGFSARGLDRLLREGRAAWDEKDTYIQAHQYPDPHVRYGRVFAESGARIAANDVSDGIGHEGREIAEASGTDVTIDWEALPFVERFKEFEEREEWMLHGGEDFCLIGAASPDVFAELQRVLKKENLPLYRIGTVDAGSGNVWLRRADGERKLLQSGGYTHF
jgi:thiamine-monophosphate kinase